MSNNRVAADGLEISVVMQSFLAAAEHERYAASVLPFCLFTLTWTAILNDTLPDEPLPDAFWYGVAQFNQREFYACHDTLEALWIEATEPDKKFYQGILQVAVALYHLGNQNWRGAVLLMGEGLNRLRDYQPTYAAIDVEHFWAQTYQILTTLQQAGPDRVVVVMQQLGLLPPENGVPDSEPPLLAFPTLQKIG